jgi:hypothetical protein
LIFNSSKPPKSRNVDWNYEIKPLSPVCRPAGDQPGSGRFDRQVGDAAEEAVARLLVAIGGR